MPNAKIKSVSFLYFLVFFCSVITAYLIYQPSWGLMDDHSFLNFADGIWNSDNVPKAIWNAVVEDWLGKKMRPIFILYAAIVYKFFTDNPTLLYCLIFIVFGSVLPVWGIIFHRCYRPNEKAGDDAIFLFPLTFFLFPPFWNIFMYISLQEKLIFFFGTFAVYFLVESYQNKKNSAALLTFVFILLALLSKPTGIYLIGFIIAIGALDLVFIKENKKLSTIYLVIGLIVLALYYTAVTHIVGNLGYSSKYVQNLNILGIFQSILRASIVLKILLVAAFIILIINIRKPKTSATILSLIFPTGYIAYVAILSPWAMVNYLLAPVTPFIFGMFYPFYLASVSAAAKTRYRYWPLTAIIILTFLIFVQIIIPRINKIAEIKKVVQKIIHLKEQFTDAKFFFPPPFVESHAAICIYSQTPIEYLQDGNLANEKLTSPDNFLIFRDESSNIRLSNAALAGTVFENTTWRIFRIGPAPGHREKTDIHFQKTLLQKLTEKLRDI